MKFEHFALNVPDVRAQVSWWVANLGLKVSRSRADEPYTHFLADETGRTFIELYSNLAAPMPDYRAMPPLVLHVAFVSASVAADRVRLEKAGASFVSAETTPDGSQLLMMRDPWGVALQFCQRTNAF